MIRLRRALLAAIVVVGWAGACGASAAIAAVNVEVVQTTESLSQALTRLPNVTFSHTQPKGVPVIHYNAQIRYQRIRGFGGAVTDTSAWLIEDQTSQAERTALIDDLFARSGIHLDFMLVPMGATDFTRTEQPYSYDDLPPGDSDRSLAHFSIAHDQAYIIPLLRQVMAINPQVKLFATPWSPPGWMKANDSLNNQRHTGTLLGSDYEPLGQYFVRFLRAYQTAGVPIAAIAPSNEPTNATQYPGLQLPEPDEANFISRYLAPALAAARLKTEVYGDNLGLDSSPYAQALSRSVPSSDLYGIAWHCYHGSPLAMQTEHNLYPRLDQIMTECSPGLDPSVAETVISSLRNWASTVELFNLALNPQGGPVEPPNRGCPGCTAAATVNGAADQFRLNLNYYQLGQASHFIESRAARVGGENFVSYNIAGNDPAISTPGLDDVAVENPDRSKIIVAYNSSNAPIRFAVAWAHSWFTYQLPPETTVTFAWDRRPTVPQ
jgi:glucosylceramidase